jgi:2-phospho-L-lactate/phosphoenolpyruvate guanylyltransferase
MDGVARWSVVIPAKRLAVAKSRLRPATAGGSHDDWVLALLADTVAAAAASPAVAAVLVVTDEPAAAAVVRELGATVVPDEPDRGLNPALAHGARRAPTDAVAALSSDLPALREAEVTAALTAAEQAPRCFVADAAGTGTTLLTALGTALAPRFGRDSARAHRESGAQPLAGEWPGLTRDVDTAEDLAAAAELGLGPRTAALVAGFSRPRRPPAVHPGAAR